MTETPHYALPLRLGPDGDFVTVEQDTLAAIEQQLSEHEPRAEYHAAANQGRGSAGHHGADGAHRMGRTVGD
jgi:hypothetical protein